MVLVLVWFWYWFWYWSGTGSGTGLNWSGTGLTVVGDGLGGSLVGSVRVAFLVLGLPGVVDLQTPVELLPAGGQQLDVCNNNNNNNRILLSLSVSVSVLVSLPLPVMTSFFFAFPASLVTLWSYRRPGGDSNSSRRVLNRR